MKKFICTVVLIFLLVNFSCSAYSAQNMVGIKVSGTDELVVKIEANFDYCAASFEFEYNRASMDFVSSVFSDSTEGAIALINPDYSQNSVKVSVISVNPIGAGEICEMRFEKKEYYGGDVALNIINACFADENEQIIEFDAAGAIVGFPEKYYDSIIPPSDGDAATDSNDETAPPSNSGADSAPNKGTAVVGKKPETDFTVADNTVASVIENPFSDVEQTNWFYDAVCFVYQKGITQGVSDTTFAPHNKVTRGQFVTMLCRAYSISEMTGDNFSDCGDTWYTGYLAAAKQLGISKGTGNNNFAPEKEISREEMVTLIYNYFKSAGEVDGEYFEIGFADNASVSEWAREAVAYATQKGIVNGKENNIFDPKGCATRAELAQVFFNILK